MRFKNISFEISGIKEVRIDGELYTRQTGTHTTPGGKIVINKYFRREKDGYMIHEHKFMRKLEKIARERQRQTFTFTEVNDFSDVKTYTGAGSVNKWRFWFSGETINIERILV